MKRFLPYVLVGLLILFLAGISAMQGRMAAPPPALSEEEAALAPPTPGGIPVRSFGNKKAKVQIKAYYPFKRGHGEIAALLERVSKKFGDKVGVRIVDFSTEEGQKIWKADGKNCGGIFINGKDTVEMETAGRNYTAKFAKGIGGSWDSIDLERAVLMEIEKRNGQP